jgi:tRNA uridine 5-carbamoylmethylation protein Kti12
MMATLYLMTGIPGSGKTTCINQYKRDNQVHISRDEVRFSMLGACDEYFAKEKEVFKTWIERIQYTLDAGRDVFADATHLTKSSRNKTLNHLNLKNHRVVVVNVLTDLGVALKRNDKREGRAHVPQKVIENMSVSYEKAQIYENPLYDVVIDFKGGYEF